jgi:hypothetical protein
MLNTKISHWQRLLLLKHGKYVVKNALTKTVAHTGHGLNKAIQENLSEANAFSNQREETYVQVKGRSREVKNVPDLQVEVTYKYITWDFYLFLFFRVST